MALLEGLTAFLLGIVAIRMAVRGFSESSWCTAVPMNYLADYLLQWCIARAPSGNCVLCKATGEVLRSKVFTVKTIFVEHSWGLIKQLVVNKTNKLCGE